MLLVILAIWFGYKKARDTGRNKYAWAAIAAGVFIGTQLVIGLTFGIFIGIGQQAWGWSEGTFDRYSVLISIVATVASFVALLCVFRYLDRPRTTLDGPEPPPPPTFGNLE